MVLMELITKKNLYPYLKENNLRDSNITTFCYLLWQQKFTKCRFKGGKIHIEICWYMKGTQRRKYIHAVHLTTSNKSLSGGVCKSPYYWKSKIRGKGEWVTFFFFFTPFPRTPGNAHRDSDEKAAGPEGEKSTRISVSTLSGLMQHCGK